MRTLTRSEIDNSFYTEILYKAFTKNALKISLLIPTLNESSNLKYLLPALPDYIYEVILIDGNSRDDTVAVAKQLYLDLKIVFQKSTGKGDAIKAGIEAARGDIVCIIDADCSMNISELPLFIIPLYNGFDFSKGSRFVLGGGTDDMPLIRMFGNTMFTMLANLLYKGKFTDITYGYNAFWKNAIAGMDLKTDGFEMEIELFIKAQKKQLNIIEIPCWEHKRRSGKGKLHTFRDGWKILKVIIKERLH